MKKVYTHENRFIVSNAKNIVEASGIQVVLRNEFSAGASGDLSPFDTWVELWVLNDEDYELAVNVLAEAFENADAPTWVCAACGETNEASFELCWNCQRMA